MAGNDAKTVLLISSDTFNNDQEFVDSSFGTPPAVLTNISNLYHTSTFSIFGATSVRVGGYSGLSIGQLPDENLDLVGDFTIDFWVRVGYDDYGTLCEFVNAAGDTLLMVALSTYLTDPDVHVAIYSDTGLNLRSPVAWYNSWRHVAIVRLGPTVVIYIDGVETASATWTAPISAATEMAIFHNVYFNYSKADAYVDEFKISSMARWKSNFTPPPLPYTGVSNPGNSGNTVLLIHSDTTNGSATFEDASVGGLTHLPVAVGTAQHSTTRSMFKGSSIRLAGGFDAIQVPQSADFAFGVSDFTIDLWIYPEATSSTSTIIYKGGAVAENAIILKTINTLTDFYLEVDSNGVTVLSQSTAPALSYGVWYHIAIVKLSGALYLYVNGILSASAVFTDLLVSSEDISLGSTPTAVPNSFYGYIDEFRISTTAFWSADFIPYYFEYGVLESNLTSTIGVQATVTGKSIITSTIDNAIGVSVSTDIQAPVLVSVDSSIGLLAEINASGLQPVGINVAIGLETDLTATSTRDLSIASTIGLSAGIRGIAYDLEYPTAISATIGLSATVEAYLERRPEITCAIGLKAGISIIQLPEAGLTVGIGLKAEYGIDIGKAAFVRCDIGLGAVIQGNAAIPVELACAIAMRSKVTMIRDNKIAMPIAIGLGSDLILSSEAVQESCQLPDFSGRWV